MYLKIIAISRLGREPELRYLPDGTAVCNFSAASNYKKKNGDKITTWLRVSVFGNQAEACNTYLKVGSKVLIEGRLNPDENGGPRVFQKNDGTWGASYEITAERVVFMDTRTPITSEEVREQPPEDEMDIPF